MKKFIFPESITKYDRIRSVEEVKEIMKTDLNQYPGLKYNIRKFYNRKVDKSAIQAQCSECKAKMWFSQNKSLQCFELTQTIAEHEHE